MAVLADIPARLDAEALAKRLHLAPGGADARAFETLLAEALAAARPKALYKEAFVDGRGDDWVVLDGVRFTSRALRRNLDKVERVFAYVATCGREVDRLAADAADFLKPFWLDAIKAALLGLARQHLFGHLDQRYALAKTATMSPGAADATVWPIEQQRQLFALLGDVDGEIGVALTESCLMVPTKSVSGVRFATEVDFRSCQLCRRERCPGRSAPFDRALWESVERV
jgi:hypothetical protein